MVRQKPLVVPFAEIAIAVLFPVSIFPARAMLKVFPPSPPSHET
jgi:hypothetical protein